MTMFLAIAASFGVAEGLSGAELMYVGTYTSRAGSHGIYSVRLNPQNGELTSPELAVETTDPSYLAVDAKHRRVYAANEVDKGRISSFSIGADSRLTALNSQTSGGSGPCHVSVSPGEGFVFAANYGDGSATAIPILGDGSLGVPVGVFKNAGHGPQEDRQEGPHLHWIAAGPSGKTVYACDLGTDEILLFDADLKKGRVDLVQPKRVHTTAGNGPRHGAFNRDGSILYVDNELANMVTVYRVGDKDPALTKLQEISTLPHGAVAHQTTTAEIALHPNGKWLFVSNRGFDSIASYRIAKDGTLSLIEIKPVAVKVPRGFAIDPSGKWLVVAGQESHDLTSFKIDGSTGKITPVARVSLDSPVCVVFVAGR